MTNAVVTTLLLFCLLVPCIYSAQHTAIVRRKYSSENNYLIVELLQDHLAHFEYGTGSGPKVDDPISTTPMVARTQYPGPVEFSEQGSVLTTGDFTITIAPSTLCATFVNRKLNYQVTTICPSSPFHQATFKNLTIAKASAQAVYGLGEQFFAGGETNGDYVGRIRTPGCGYYGNDMCGYQYVTLFVSRAACLYAYVSCATSGGATGNAQFPVMYAVGKENYQYGLFVDSIYRQDWNFQTSPFTVTICVSVFSYVSVLTHPNS